MIRMVNKEKVRKVLPKVLVNNDPRYSNPLYEYQSKKRKLDRFERKRSSFFNYHFRRIVKAFDEFEKAMNQEVEF